MSRNFGCDSKFAVAAAVGVGALALYGCSYMYKKKQAQLPPKKWRTVGALSELICYPIKSCGPINLTRSDCSILGLQDGQMRDRVFMLITREGQFITARTYPKMVLIQPHFNGNIMKLTAPGMPDIQIDVADLYNTSPITASVWQQPVSAIDCGEELAIWLSRFILSEDMGIRMVFYPDTVSQRPVRGKNTRYENLTSVDSGSLHDATSYMLINESSITELNSRLDEDVKPLRFRPNFVVKGAFAFEEDNWEWIKIGNTIFRNVKACTRCIFTNIDPITGNRHPDQQPLKTLKEYRSIIPDDSPVMGIHLGVKVTGSVNIGDAVYVGVKE